MPAINPARLKVRCAEIGEAFSDPQQFIAKLHDLLNYYADRVRRPGEVSQPLPLMKAYLVPTPVMRCLEQELMPRAAVSPQETLSLADTLWEEEWLETRHLAAVLLGSLPTDSPGPLCERVRRWGETCQEKSLQRILYDQGVSKLRRSHQEGFLRLVGDLLGSSDKEHQRGGLYALAALLREDTFQNLPVVYRMLGRLLQQESTSLQKEIVAVIKEMAKHSQPETAFFLHEKLKTAAKPRITRVVRRSLPFFSGEHEASLRSDLRDRR